MTEGRQRSYMLTVLATIFCFNSVDRFAISLFLQDIKRDLALSDTQLGLMTGIAFAAFYSIMGVPLARWADRGNRVTILGFTTILWSMALIACGLARNFLQLLVIRIAVAVGEAGCTPVAHSLIAEHYSRAERPRAVARFLLGGSAGALIGYFVAGWLNNRFGWRVAFALLGLPGLPLAILACLTLREPRKSQWKDAAATGDRHRDTLAAPTPPSMAQVLRVMSRVRAFRHLLAGNSVLFFLYYGVSKWQPTFFIRSYAMPVHEVGAWFGVILGGGMLIGTILSGEWPRRLAPQNERRQLLILSAIFCTLIPISVGIYLAEDRHFAFLFMAVNAVVMAATFGPLYATIPMVVPETMRAMSIALVYLFANLIGMGLGPLAVGAISDALHATFGAESLRFALLLMTPGYVWGAWHLFRASRYIAADIDHATRTNEAGNRAAFMTAPRDIAAS